MKWLRYCLADFAGLVPREFEISDGLCLMVL